VSFEIGWESRQQWQQASRRIKTIFIFNTANLIEYSKRRREEFFLQQIMKGRGNLALRTNFSG